MNITSSTLLLLTQNLNQIWFFLKIYQWMIVLSVCLVRQNLERWLLDRQNTKQVIDNFAQLQSLVIVR